jgi:hypothetical protein
MEAETETKISSSSPPMIRKLAYMQQYNSTLPTFTDSMNTNRLFQKEVLFS